MSEHTPTKIAEQIENSRVFSEERKILLLQALPFLSEDGAAELQKILEQGEQTLLDIEAKAKIEHDAIEQEFSQTIDQTFKTQLELATTELEEREKQRSEDILKKLDRV